MRFYVQPVKLNPTKPAAAEWAILLDNEHRLFVGSYRECEDWLDRYADFSKLPLKHAARGLFPASFGQQRCWEALRACWNRFLTNERGSVESLELLLVAAVLAGMYAITAAATLPLISKAAAWHRESLHSVSALRGCHAQVGAVSGDGIEIACALAPEDEDVIPNQLPPRTRAD